jgi:hypothetical protein
MGFLGEKYKHSHLASIHPTDDFKKCEKKINFTFLEGRGVLGWDHFPTSLSPYQMEFNLLNLLIRL